MGFNESCSLPQTQDKYRPALSFEYPYATSSEALVHVGAISLNRGEVRRVLAAETSWRPGWDLAGVVERIAEDGTGPKQGARVVGLLPSGTWSS